MMFGRPWLLLLLALPALQIYWTWTRQRRRVVLPLDHGRAGSGAVLRGLLGVCESLPALVLANAVLMLAWPQELSAPKVKRALTNIQFCVDISGSMTAKFGSGNRYDAAMAAINEFLGYREGDAFGLTFFGNNFLHWVPLTSDPSAFQCAIPFMRPENNIPGFGGTEIGKAVLGCREVLVERQEGDRMIVLVTDGWSSDLAGDAATEIARKLRMDDIVVYAINIQDADARAEIVDLTRLTGGDVFNPGDTRALREVFQTIDTMQKAKLEKGSAEVVDWFEPFCIVGLSLLGLWALVQLGLRYTPW
ncbi:MAG: VWA domain-containing protein [Planctomycetota bacterium]